MRVSRRRFIQGLGALAVAVHLPPVSDAVAAQFDALPVMPDDPGWGGIEGGGMAVEGRTVRFRFADLSNPDTLYQMAEMPDKSLAWAERVPYFPVDAWAEFNRGFQWRGWVRAGADYHGVIRVGMLTPDGMGQTLAIGPGMTAPFKFQHESPEAVLFLEVGRPPESEPLPVGTGTVAGDPAHVYGMPPGSVEIMPTVSAPESYEVVPLGDDGRPVFDTANGWDRVAPVTHYGFTMGNANRLHGSATPVARMEDGRVGYRLTPWADSFAVSDADDAGADW